MLILELNANRLWDYHLADCATGLMIAAWMLLVVGCIRFFNFVSVQAVLFLGFQFQLSWYCSFCPILSLALPSFELIADVIPIHVGR